MEPNRKRSVYVISTGGTIASSPVNSTQTTAYSGIKFCADELIDCIPGVRERFDLKAEQIFSVGSSALTDADLLKLSRRINDLLASDGVDGVVVTHGTDTMEETAFFLNLTVHSSKPVIITGSMRPTTVLSADGPLNLYNSIVAAADIQSQGKGIMVCMNDKLMPARDVVKASTCHVDAFICAEYGPLGTVNGGRVRYNYNPSKPHTVQSEFDVSELTELPRVEIVYTHISCGDFMFRAALQSGCDGIVIAGTGNGSAPPDIRAACMGRSGDAPAVVRASRVQGGYVGESGAFGDIKHRTVASGDFPPHKARILLQLALTKTKDIEQLRRIFERY